MDRKSRTLPATRVTPAEFNIVMKAIQFSNVQISEIIRAAVLDYCTKLTEKNVIVSDKTAIEELMGISQKLPPDDLREILEYARYRLEKSHKL